MTEEWSGGGTVPLGTGDTDFEALFDCLDEIGYEGDFVLQVARGADGDGRALAGRRIAPRYEATHGQ